MAMKDLWTSLFINGWLMKRFGLHETTVNTGHLQCDCQTARDERRLQSLPKITHASTSFMCYHTKNVLTHDTQFQQLVLTCSNITTGATRVKRDRMKNQVWIWSDLSWGGRMLLSSAIWTDGSHPFSVRSSTCRTLPTVSRLSVWIALLLPEVIFTGHHTGGARGWDFYWQGHVQSARITSQHKPNPFLMDFWYILHTWWSRMLMHNAFARV